MIRVILKKVGRVLESSRYRYSQNSVSILGEDSINM